MKPISKKIRLFATVLSVVMLFCSIPWATATTTEGEIPIEDLIAAQEQAVKANEILMQYFFANGWVLEYPDYFGGCYIEDNVLHIRLVEPTIEELGILEEILYAYENVVTFEYTNYSLSSIQEYADSTAAKLIEEGIRVTKWYVDVTTGNVVIGVIPDDIDRTNGRVAQIQNHKNKSSAPKIVIVEGDYTSATSDPFTGGSTIMIDASLRSAGTCGYYKGNNALVTCGHGNTTNGSAVKFNGAQIGTEELIFLQL